LWGIESMYPPREGALRWGGVRRQDVAREAHGGVQTLLASRLRPLSSKATHPPNYRSLHTARCPCRRGRYRPRLKGTQLLLRKENIEIGASYQLAPWQTSIPTRVVVDTGAGPSVIRADMLPEGWTEYASRAPPRTQVSDASGQLLKVNAEVSLTNHVGGAAME